MKHFLNSEMEKRKNLDPKEIDKLRLVFKKSVEVIRHIFGNKAFRLITLDNAMDPRSTKATRFNQGLFDILMNGFTYYDKRQVIPLHAEAIAKKLRYLSTYDVDFINAVTGTGTDSTQKVKQKFDIWRQALNKILEYPTNEPRAFPKQLKEQLFETNPVCAICHQSIQDIDDAEVDHIYSYSKGGQTISSNASLTHRLCNRQKGDKDLTTSAPITYNKPIPQNHESSVSKLQNEIQSHDTIKIPLKTEISDASSHSDNHNLSYKLTFKSLDKMPKDKILREHGGTSRKKYIFPILEYLVQNNGIISNKIAYQLIELKFGKDFTPVDFNFCKDGVTKKWEESLDWMKSDMKKSGMLKQEVRTEWKITEYGKECYERLKKNPSTIIKINEGIISFESP